MRGTSSTRVPRLSLSGTRFALIHHLLHPYVTPPLQTGNVFGGFATDSWRLGPKFYGKPESFLFQLSPTVGVFDSTPFNSNYQYFNLKQKTMPNGLGMGGQLEYFGLWIDSEFGLVRKLFLERKF